MDGDFSWECCVVEVWNHHSKGFLAVTSWHIFGVIYVGGYHTPFICGNLVSGFNKMTLQQPE